MKICKDCAEHKMFYDEIVDKDCECYCHIEMENGCVCDPCCR